MKQFKKSYYNKKWFDYSNLVKSRDGFKCLKCGRDKTKVVLQTHHKNYIVGLKPWEYPLSDCLTLCKGCHSREHGLVEPDSGWELLFVEDLGDMSGTCERKGCGKEIRYTHTIYHPLWGQKIVGSTCIDYLTKEDQFISHRVVKFFQKISKFIYESDWKHGLTKNGKTFRYTKYSHNIIRIYGKKNYYSYQIALKVKGERWHDFKKVFYCNNKNINQVKELSFVALKGMLAETDEEKEILRNIYISLIK